MQKWSKGKQKEKVNNMVLFDKGTYDKLITEAPKYKLITPSVLSDRLRVCVFFQHGSSYYVLNMKCVLCNVNMLAYKNEFLSTVGHLDQLLKYIAQGSVWYSL